MTTAPGGQQQPGWRRLVREPGVHFILLGVLFFGLHAFVRQRGAHHGPEPIVVTVAAIESIRSEMTRLLGRAPTDAELRVRVARTIDDEVLFREAIRRGLDRGDDAIRRRLVQRMAFVLHDPDATAAPDDAALRAFMQSHAERFSAPARVSFRQVFFSRVLRRDHADSDARAAREALGRGEQPQPAGDPMPLGTMMEGRTMSGLASDFGADFANAIAAAPAGTWVGPIESRFGLHVVQVTGREPGGLMTLEQVRGRVMAEYLEAQRTEATESALRALRSQYTVRIEWPGGR